MGRSLDNGSATFVEPGLYITVKLHGDKRSTHLSILAGGLDVVEYIFSSGL